MYAGWHSYPPARHPFSKTELMLTYMWKHYHAINYQPCFIVCPEYCGAELPSAATSPCPWENWYFHFTFTHNNGTHNTTSDLDNISDSREWETDVIYFAVIVSVILHSFFSPIRVSSSYIMRHELYYMI